MERKTLPYAEATPAIREAFALGLALAGTPLREACSRYAAMFGGAPVHQITNLAGVYLKLAKEGHEPALKVVLASQYMHDYCSRNNIHLPGSFPKELDKPVKLVGTWNASNGY